MKKFEKSSKLEGVSYDVRGPVLEEAEKIMLGERAKRLDEVDFALSRMKK